MDAGAASRDLRALLAARELGFDAVQIAHGEDGDEARQAGLSVYRHQLVAKGALEKTDEQWKTLFDEFVRHRDPKAIAPPQPLTGPLVRADLVVGLAKELVAIGGLDVVAASLGDEISFTKNANPFDLDHRPATVRAFRRFLKIRYGDSERLRDVWGHDATLSAVLPLSVDAIRARELGPLELPKNLAPFHDMLSFCDRELAMVVDELMAKAESTRPDLPVGLTGMQPPSAFGGHDYNRLVPKLGLIEAYDIGGARDLADCLARPGALRWATVFVPADDAPQIDLLRMSSGIGALVAHGFDGAVFWSDRNVLGRNGSRVVPTSQGGVLQRTFAALEPAARRFAGARIVRDPVWIVESQRSVQVHWMLDSALDGETWIRRLSSYEAENGTSLAVRQSWLEVLTDLGIQARLVPEDRLVAGLADPASVSRPRVVVLPAMLSLSDAACRALVDFVQEGGRVVADHSCAFYDEFLRRRPEPALDRMFGIGERRIPRLDDMRIRNGRARPATTRTERGLAIGESGVRGGGVSEPVRAWDAEETSRARGTLKPLAEYVHFERNVGRGVATYLNLAVCEYRALRLDPAKTTAARAMRERVARILEEASVQPRVVVRGEGLPTLIERVVLRPRSGSGRLLAIRIDGTDDPQLAALLRRRGAVAAEMSLPEGQPFRVKQLGPGKPKDLGVGTRFEFTLDPWQPAFFELQAIGASGGE